VQIAEAALRGMTVPSSNCTALRALRNSITEHRIHSGVLAVKAMAKTVQTVVCTDHKAIPGWPAMLLV